MLCNVATMNDLIKDNSFLREKVISILLHSPEARTNDNLLCFIYWNLAYQVGEERIKDLTPAETITRIRRKLNAEGKFITPATRELRKQREQDVKKWAKKW